MPTFELDQFISRNKKISKHIINILKNILLILNSNSEDDQLFCLLDNYIKFFDYYLINANKIELILNVEQINSTLSIKKSEWNNIHKNFNSQFYYLWNDVFQQIIIMKNKQINLLISTQLNLKVIKKYFSNI